MAYDIGPLEGRGQAGARRLLALADHLDRVGDETYDHRTWRRRRPDGSWAMCALGHAVTALPDLVGLRWREPESCDIVRLDGSGLMEDVLKLAAEAFEVSAEEAQMIFGVGLYTLAFYGGSAVFGARPRTVAAAIRAFALEKLAACEWQAVAAS
jgi:hypothetical protein